MNISDVKRKLYPFIHNFKREREREMQWENKKFHFSVNEYASSYWVIQQYFL